MLVEPRHLNNAPLREALVDIRVEPRESFQPESFRLVELEDFPIRDDQNMAMFSFSLMGGKPSTAPGTKSQLNGVFFRTEDRRTLVQFRVDGFTYNKLRPYTSWEDIWPAASKLWRRYQEVTEPTAVLRLALRYINEFDKHTGFQFRDVLTFEPPLPGSLSPTVDIERYTAKVSIRSKDGRLKAHISQGADTKRGSDTASLLLDIDAFWKMDGDESGERLDTTISNVFSRLHAFKNEIFFACLTEQQLKEFE